MFICNEKNHTQEVQQIYFSPFFSNQLSELAMISDDFISGSAYLTSHELVFNKHILQNGDTHALSIKKSAIQFLLKALNVMPFTM